MSDTVRLSELLLRWEEGQEKGQPPSLSELCADCPEVLPELRRRVRALAAINAALGADADEGTDDPTATAPGTRGEGDPSAPAVPGYEVLGLLGRGGMGAVYRARQRSLDRGVALKVLLADRQAGPERLARIRAEAQALARLKHPNIVQVYEVGEQGGRPFFVLEFAPGGPLACKLAAARVLSVTPAAPVTSAAMPKNCPSQARRPAVYARPL
ncbi:MAG TPA: protein kinase [Gemmataceae bacterium]|nr:protein kinase [Gemmataceae bacterium]